MKKLLLPLLISLALLGGCLTSDYNLRVINDTDRYYEGHVSDSTSTLMKWNTPDWKEKNVKYWSSGGVIITNAYNAFYENSWLADLVANGFKGQVFVEDPTVLMINTAWGSNQTWIETTNWFTTTYNFKISYMSNIINTVNPAIPLITTDDTNFPFEIYSTFHLSPLIWENLTFADGYADMWYTEFSKADSAIADTDSSVSWGICVDNYNTSKWTYGETYFNDELDNIDPAGLGHTYDLYTTQERKNMLSAEQNAKISAYKRKEIEVIVKGDRLMDELETNKSLINEEIIGYFFNEVNPTNIGDVETKINLLRSVNEATLPSKSLILIAGVKNDVYHEESPTIYTQLIKRIVDDGMYFTPGADNDYWNMPMTNPGDWWIRNNNDINWQSQAPTYASNELGPRKIMNVVDEIIPESLVFETFSLDSLTEGTTLEANVKARINIDGFTRRLIWSTSFPDTSTLNWYGGSKNHDAVLDSGEPVPVLSDSTVRLSWDSATNHDGYKIQARYDIGQGVSEWEDLTYQHPDSNGFTHSANDDTLAIQSGKWEYRIYSFIGTPTSIDTLSEVVTLPSAMFINSLEINVQYHAITDTTLSFNNVMSSDILDTLYIK